MLAQAALCGTVSGTVIVRQGLAPLLDISLFAKLSLAQPGLTSLHLSWVPSSASLVQCSSVSTLAPPSVTLLVTCSSDGLCATFTRLDGIILITAPSSGAMIGCSLTQLVPSTAEVLLSGALSGRAVLSQASLLDPVLLNVTLSATTSLALGAAYLSITDSAAPVPASQTCASPGLIFNPLGVVAGCSTPDQCAVGDLSAKIGTVFLTATASPVSLLAQDVSLSLLGPASVLYRTLVVRVGNTVVCSTISPPILPRTASARFYDGITGIVTFSQSDASSREHCHGPEQRCK